MVFVCALQQNTVGLTVALINNMNFNPLSFREKIYHV